jgi:hypothetical protein
MVPLSALSGELAASADACRGATPQGRWMMPVASLLDAEEVQVALLKGCDFVVVMPKRAASDRQLETFIGRRKVTLLPDDIAPDHVQYADGTVEPVVSVRRSSYAPVLISDQVHWLSEERAWATVPGDGCYFGPVSHNVRLAGDQFAINKDGLRSVAVFEFLTVPLVRKIKRCMYAYDEKVTIRLKTKSVHSVWLLGDGGYLILMDDDLLVRMDSQLDVGGAMPEKYAVAETPSELVGVNPVESILLMPLMQGFEGQCKKMRGGCSLQRTHDELIRRLRRAKSSHRGAGGPGDL